MRRAVLALSLSLVCAAFLLVWAVRPVTDDLNRSCGGGIFSTTVGDASDDSYMDVCDGIRAAREQVVEPLAVVTGLALTVSLGTVVFLVDERRHVLR